MKLIIFVHTCKLYEESRAKLIESTWGDNANVVFITDNESSSLKNHVNLGPYIPGPTYHPVTVYKMFMLFLNKYSDYDWFMIIDDDSYLYIEKLKTYLSFFNKADCYMIGDYLNWVTYNKNFTYDYNAWISGGPGIVFSKSCIETLTQLMATVNINVTNHDVFLHNLYKQSGKKIKRVDCPGFHQYGSNELIKSHPTSSNQLISVHLERNMELLQKFHNL